MSSINLTLTHWARWSISKVLRGTKKVYLWKALIASGWIQLLFELFFLILNLPIEQSIFENGPSKICEKQSLKIWRDMVGFRQSKGCPPQILLGPFLNTLCPIYSWHVKKALWKHSCITVQFLHSDSEKCKLHVLLFCLVAIVVEVPISDSEHYPIIWLLSM